MEEKLIAKRILDELLTFFVEGQAESIRMGIDYVANGFYVQLVGRVTAEQSSVDHLTQLLAEPRNPSLEEYYEDLLGMAHHEVEDYHLLGLMVDEVELSFEEGILNIKLFRENLNAP